MGIKLNYGYLIPNFIPPKSLNFMDNEEKNRYVYLDNSSDTQEIKQLAFKKLQEILDD